MINNAEDITDAVNIVSYPDQGGESTQIVFDEGTMIDVKSGTFGAEVSLGVDPNVSSIIEFSHVGFGFVEEYILITNSDGSTLKMYPPSATSCSMVYSDVSGMTFPFEVPVDVTVDGRRRLQQLPSWGTVKEAVDTGCAAQETYTKSREFLQEGCKAFEKIGETRASAIGCIASALAVGWSNPFAARAACAAIVRATKTFGVTCRQVPKLPPVPKAIEIGCDANDKVEDLPRWGQKTPDTPPETPDCVDMHAECPTYKDNNANPNCPCYIRVNCCQWWGARNCGSPESGCFALTADIEAEFLRIDPGYVRCPERCCNGNPRVSPKYC